MISPSNRLSRSFFLLLRLPSTSTSSSSFPLSPFRRLTLCTGKCEEKSVQNKVSSVRKATRSVVSLSAACFAAHHLILCRPALVFDVISIFFPLFSSCFVSNGVYLLAVHSSINRERESFLIV